MQFSATFIFVALGLSAIASVHGVETLDAANITAHWMFPKLKNIPAACDSKQNEQGFFTNRMLNILRGQACADMFAVWPSTAHYDASDYAVLYSRRMPVVLPAVATCFNSIMAFWDRTCLHESYHRPSIRFAGFQSFLRFISFYGHPELETALNEDYGKCFNMPAYQDVFCKFIYDNRDSSKNYLDSIFRESYKIRNEMHKICLAYETSSTCLSSKAAVCGNPKYKTYIEVHFSNILRHFDCASHLKAPSEQKKTGGASSLFYSFNFILVSLGILFHF